MKNKYYLYKIRKILDKNTHFYNKERAGEILPYIMTNEKDYYKLMYYINKLLKGSKK